MADQQKRMADQQAHTAPHTAPGHHIMLHHSLLRTSSPPQARQTGDPAVENFFQDLNTKLFDGIAALQEEGVRELTPELMEERLGMGPSDAAFVRELFRQLGLDRVSVKDHARCCFGCGPP